MALTGPAGTVARGRAGAYAGLQHFDFSKVVADAQEAGAGSSRSPSHFVQRGTEPRATLCGAFKPQAMRSPLSE